VNVGYFCGKLKGFNLGLGKPFWKQQINPCDLESQPFQKFILALHAFQKLNFNQSMY
jgi:hypothetical protein